MFKPVEKFTFSRAIINQIKENLSSGVWKPGQKLPSEKELCAEFSVSRVVLREALKALEFLGILIIRPGDGTYVNEDVLAPIVEPLSLDLLLKRNILLELLEARKILETQMAAVAAEKADAEDLKKMEQAVQRMDKSRDLVNEALQADLDFHLFLAKATKNRVLAKIMMVITDLMMESFRTAVRIPGGIGKAIQFHGEILSAITKRRPDLARRNMMQHLEDAQEDLRKALDIEQR